MHAAEHASIERLMMPAKRQISDLDLESLGALHQQWMRADLLRTLFERALAEETTEHSQGVLDLLLIVQPVGIFMYLWHALLFSVLEGCRERKLDLSFLLLSLDEELYQGMKALRHTVFNTSKHDYWDNRMFTVLGQPDAVNRTIRIHDGLSTYLSDEIRRRSLDPRAQR